MGDDPVPPRPDGDPVEDDTRLAEDSPAARRRWLLRVVLILVAMIVVPGVLYRLAAPDPVAVTVAPLPPGAPEALSALAEELGPALDERPTLTVVPWRAGEPEAAALVLELDAPTDLGSGAAVLVHLYRGPERTLVWRGRVTAPAPDSLPGRVADAVGEAVRGAR